MVLVCCWSGAAAELLCMWCGDGALWSCSGAAPVFVGWCPAGMVVVWSLLVLVGCWSSVWVVLEWCLLWCLGSCAGL